VNAQRWEKIQVSFDDPAFAAFRTDPRFTGSQDGPDRASGRHNHT